MVTHTYETVQYENVNLFSPEITSKAIFSLTSL